MTARMVYSQKARPGKWDDAVEKFIDAFWLENCYSPTYEEIREAVGVPNVSQVRTIVLKIAIRRGDMILIGTKRNIYPRWVQERIQSEPVATN